MLDYLSRTRRAASAGISALAILLIVTACQTTDPSADKLREALEDGVELAGFKADPALRARFHPPIGNGKQVKNGDFVDGMQLEVAAFRLVDGDEEAVGAPLGPIFSTLSETHPITVEGETYELVWPVTEPEAAERVRVEIRMVGSGDAPVCNELGGECLGYLDVRVVERGGNGRGGGSGAGMITVPSGSDLAARFKVLAPSGLADIAALSNQGGLDPEAGSCGANSLTLPGQGLQAVGAGLQAVGAGLQAVGAAGGLFLSPNAALDGRTVTPADLASVLAADVPGLDGAGATKTVLIVLDDFGGAYRLPKVLTEYDLNDQTDIQALLDAGTLSHGALVWTELNAIATAVFGAGTAGTYDDGSPYVEYGDAHGLLIRAVDARDPESGSIDTETAATNLTAALELAQDDGYQRAVVNMSFAIVPCAVLADFGSTEPVYFEDYVAALLAHNGVTGAVAANLSAGFRTPVDLLNDPLLDHLACPLGSVGPCGAGFEAIVHVAASGNYGSEFPLFPAALAGVVSVGAQPFESGYGQEASEFSNLAQVLAPGDAIELRDDGTHGLSLVGTSFAAPFVSLFAALDQRAPTPVCDAGDPRDPASQPSELASGGLDELPLLPGFATGGSDALTDLCGG